MKAFAFSDLHIDDWCPVMRQSYEATVYDTMNKLWKNKQVPETPAILMAGDLANDIITYKHAMRWLSRRYERVYACLGNHDILCKEKLVSFHPSEYKTSDEKIEKIKEFCDSIDNVYLLDGNEVNGVTGTMGMCDFDCGSGDYFKHRQWNSWFDGKYWTKHISDDPKVIFNHYADVMTKMIQRHPSVVLTHFVPFEAGVNEKYKNSDSNRFFYFKAEKWLDMMDDGSHWICGHTHDRKVCDWVNRSGHRIKILCNPCGYHDEFVEDTADVTKVIDGKIIRTEEKVKNEDFIIEI